MEGAGNFTVVSERHYEKGRKLASPPGCHVSITADQSWSQQTPVTD